MTTTKVSKPRKMRAWLRTHGQLVAITLITLILLFLTSQAKGHPAAAGNISGWAALCFAAYGLLGLGSLILGPGFAIWAVGDEIREDREAMKAEAEDDNHHDDEYEYEAPPYPWGTRLWRSLKWLAVWCIPLAIIAFNFVTVAKLLQTHSG